MTRAAKARPATAPSGAVKATPKRLNIALQGGGSHGAYAWGVVERLLEEDIEITGLCGTSAGAMNATVTAYGLAKGGRSGARDALAMFWKRIADVSRAGPLQPSFLDRLAGNGTLDFSPGWMLLDSLSRLASPYQLNPMNFNPLRDVLLESVDFDLLRQQTVVKLFVCASNVMTGRHRVFRETEMSVDAVLASACLPFLFQAVQVDGEHYWDGGYMGNPPLYPLFYHTDTPDVLIVQINPINIREVPTTAQAIIDRINTLSFNSSLMREMRAINFVTKLIDKGIDDDGRLRRVFIHTIDAEDHLGRLGASSKLNADWGFLQELRAVGRAKADAFLRDHFDKIGVRSSTDIEAKFL